MAKEKILAAFSESAELFHELSAIINIDKLKVELPEEDAAKVSYIKLIPVIVRVNLTWF